MLTAALLGGLVAAAPARADAPPYATTAAEIADKPELSSFLRMAGHDGKHFDTFGFDLAVPLAPRWELTLVPRFARTRGGAHDATGLGDTEVAVKYLLWSEAGDRPAIALEPNLTFPTGGRHLGAGRIAIDIPVLISKGFGPWRVSAEVGFERVGLKAGDDHAPVSVLVERTLDAHLTLGAELANDLPMRRPGRGSTEVNVGAVWSFRDGLALQTAFGRRLASPDAPADLHSTVALAIEF